MNILMVTDTYHPGFDGIVRYLDYLIPHLIAKGHQVSVICPHAKGEKVKKKEGELKKRELDSSSTIEMNKEMAEQKEIPGEEQEEGEQDLTEEKRKIAEKIEKTRRMLQWSYYGCLPMALPAAINYLSMRKNDFFTRRAKYEIKSKVMRDITRITMLLIIITVIVVLYWYDI